MLQSLYNKSYSQALRSIPWFFSLRYHNEGFTVVNSDTSPRMIFHHYELVGRSLQCWTFLAVSLVFCCATITVHVEAAEEKVWLSDVGSLGADVEIGNQTVVYGIPGSIDQEMHVWLQTAFAAQNLTAVDLNMIATNLSVLSFTGVTVENPEHDPSGCTNSPNDCRWEFTHQSPALAVSDNEVIGFNGINFQNGAGIGDVGASIPDAQYDATANAWFFATLTYNVVGIGSTDLFLQIGDNGVAAEGADLIDVEVRFGGGTDPTLNSENDRGNNSTTHDGAIGVGANLWDDVEAADFVTFGAGGGATIDLAGNRTVASIKFKDDYTLQNDQLTISTGKVTVESGLIATIEAALFSTPGLTKLGDGTLEVNGTTSATDVVAGTLGGTGTISGLEVLDGATVSPGTNPSALLMLGGQAQGAAPSQVVPEPAGVEMMALAMIFLPIFLSLSTTRMLIFQRQAVR